MGPDGYTDVRPPWRVVIGAVLLVGICALLGGQAAYLASLTQEDIWQAQSEVEFRDPLLLGETVAVTFASPSIWAPVAAREGIPEKLFLERYAAAVAGGTQVVSVTYQDPDPELAKRVVRGAVEAYLIRFAPDDGAVQRAELESYLASLRTLEADLVTTLEQPDVLLRQEQIDRQNQLIAVRQQITDVLLRIDERDTAVATDDATAPRLITDAFVGEEPVLPERAQIAVFGFAAGGMVGAAVVFLVYHVAAQRPAPPAPLQTTQPALVRPGGTRLGRFAKRSIDVIGSGVGLVLLSPLMAIIAVAIVVETGRPVLFRQTRVGRHEREFQMLKFRSMVQDNDPSEHIAYQTALLTRDDADTLTAEGGVYKLADPRITRVGAIIRRFSLDELPQLINVFRGEMSLVGPRPALTWEVPLFSERHRARASVPPGCSGLWQVSGRNLLTSRQMLELDVQYVERWSFWRDLWILIRTPFAVLRGDGAR